MASSPWKKPLKHKKDKRDKNLSLWRGGCPVQLGEREPAGLQDRTEAETGHGYAQSRTKPSAGMNVKYLVPWFSQGIGEA